MIPNKIPIANIIKRNRMAMAKKKTFVNNTESPSQNLCITQPLLKTKAELTKKPDNIAIISTFSTKKNELNTKTRASNDHFKRNFIISE